MRKNKPEKAYHGTVTTMEQRSDTTKDKDKRHGIGWRSGCVRACMHACIMGKKREGHQASIQRRDHRRRRNDRRYFLPLFHGEEEEEVDNNMNTQQGKMWMIFLSKRKGE
jgi:hypothetical protein